MIKVVSILLYPFLMTDRWGSRSLLLIGFSINVICLLYVYVYLGVSDLSGEGDHPLTFCVGRYYGHLSLCSRLGSYIGACFLFNLGMTSRMCPTPIQAQESMLRFLREVM